jgi:hypothetical protein
VIYLAAAIWGGIWWRLRGGAFTALTGIDPGTGGMRAIAAAEMSLPLAIINPRWLLMIPALWVAWSLAGWGAFQSMGTSPVDEKNWIARALERIGFRSPFWNDAVGMAIEGVMVMIWPMLVVAWLAPPHAWFVPLSGLMFSPIYLAAQKAPWLPNMGRFARAGSEWAEVGVGAWVGMVILEAAL